MSSDTHADSAPEAKTELYLPALNGSGWIQPRRDKARHSHAPELKELSAAWT